VLPFFIQTLCQDDKTFKVFIFFEIPSYFSNSTLMKINLEGFFSAMKKKREDDFRIEKETKKIKPF